MVEIIVRNNTTTGTRKCLALIVDAFPTISFVSTMLSFKSDVYTAAGKIIIILTFYTIKFNE